MADDHRYNGWTNYETWAIKLWIDNEEGSYRYWRDVTRESWDESADHSPNPFMDRSSNARWTLADRLKSEIDDNADVQELQGISGTVYADLLNAALGSVNWYEIADAMLQDEELENQDATGQYKASGCRYRADGGSQ